ncbi:hypothetical protein PRtIB026_A34480 [Pseudomonas sp. RtIB026]|nr:hypothetical protein PRtIB026_A34480 [Pseudomonas sp. RtIB026]
MLGWTYALACMAVTPMCALIATQYIQALFPALQGELQAKIIGTLLILTFLMVSSRGVAVTARVAATFLVFEIVVVAGLGMLGIINPQVSDLSVATMYSVTANNWSAVAPGVLFGVWMLANFDSAINYIEEAKVPVRTVQRSLLIVLTSAFIIYSIAAIGWQFAVPVDKLASIVESGNGGAISAIAETYLPSSMSWIALFVVITSACAGLQISSNSAARTLYRMSEEGHLPSALCAVNKFKAPRLTLALVTTVGIAIVWWKPISNIIWYYDVITITLVLSYVFALIAFLVLTWEKNAPKVALMLSAPAVLAMLVLGYIGYLAGASPVSPDDIYTAWYLGIFALVSGALIALLSKLCKLRPIIN